MLCEVRKHPDSFSGKQKKPDVEDANRYCLSHTAASGFNRQAVRCVSFFSC
jgi:hypothetical protein